MANRKISISTCFDYNIPIDEQIKLIAKSGYSYISLGESEEHSQYLTKKGRKRLKGLLNEYNLKIDTIHGPRIDQFDSVNKLKQVSIAAKDLDVSIVVVHGSPFDFKQEEFLNRLEILLNNCKTIEIIAKDMGIVLALENVLPGPATNLVRYALRELNPEYFGFCYDSSHGQIGETKPFNLIHELKDRLMVVHISDRIKEFVDHVIPGEGIINWNGLAKSLKESSFKGSFVLEVMVTHSKMKKPLEFLKLAYEKGSNLYDMVFTGGRIGAKLLKCIFIKKWGQSLFLPKEGGINAGC